VAGIYIHIPFCRQACRYCDFHFEVSVWNKRELVPILLQELRERTDYLGKDKIDTIYFGGGTPSVLETKETEAILEMIFKLYSISANPEISYEVNPEDLKREYLNHLKKTGINRLSIGIQSFHDPDLELMHRIHNSEQAIRAVRDAQQSGFSNINIDLIYGIPRQEPGHWEKNLEIAMSLGIQHFSAYHLSYEPGTIFDHWRKKGRLNPIPEDESLNQFRTLIKLAVQYGFEHYEISNFALPGFKSTHNSNYWQQEKYLGIGPSAHSYDHKSRRWNISQNNTYVKNLLSGFPYFESEILTSEDLYNEFVMTSLRMSSGVKFLQLKTQFGVKKAEHFRSKIQKYVSTGHVNFENEIYKLKEDGIFIADHIISEVFI
jgi:oxygen-independent coproporphyrinogen III oxidase